MSHISDGHDGVGRDGSASTLTTTEDIAGGVIFLRDGATEKSDFGSVEIVGGIDRHLVGDADSVCLGALRGCVGSLVAATIDIMYNQFTVIIVGVGVDDNGDLALDSAVEVAAAEDILDGTTMEIDGDVATIARGVGNSFACRTLITSETFDISGDVFETLTATEHIADSAAVDNQGKVAIEVGRLAACIDVTVGTAWAAEGDSLTSNMLNGGFTTSILIDDGTTAHINGLFSITGSSTNVTIPVTSSHKAIHLASSESR